MPKTGNTAIVPPAYSGAAFLFCWTYLMFYATSAGIESAAPISLYSTSYSISAACMVLTLLVISFARFDRAAFLCDTRTKAITGIGLSLGTSALILGGHAELFSLIVVGGVITGILSGTMLMQWVVAYQRVGLRVAAGSFPMLMAMSVGICVTLMYLPQVVMTAAIIAFPIVSELMFHEVRKQPWPHFEDEAADKPNRPINFVLMLLPFAVYALASGFLDYSSDNDNYTFAFYALGALIPVIISGVYLFVAERDSFLVAFAIPLSFLIAVCVPFLTQSALMPFAPFISIGELGIELLVFVVPIGFAEFFSIDALKTYALGRMVYVVFNGVGWYSAQFASQAFGSFMHAQMSLVIIFIGAEVLAVCLIVAIVKAQKGALVNQYAVDASTAANEMTLVATDAKTEQVDGVDAETAPFGGLDEGKREFVGIEIPDGKSIEETAAVDFDAVAEQIRLEFGLSQRERDVFVLLARGYTSTRIQKELYIAAGTVNYHSRNIYAKLGVHSKQELIELFENRVKGER